MLTGFHDDQLALTLNSEQLPYINLSFLLSSVDAPTCGGPFGVDTTVMEVSIYDSPEGSFSFGSPGTLLASDSLSGDGPGETPYTLNWASVSTSLGISGSTDGNITVVFDALRSGYLAFDNITINSSTTATIPNEASAPALYPNPVDRELRIGHTQAGGQLLPYNALGQLLLTQPALPLETRVPTEQLAPGMYYLSYVVNAQRHLYKVSKH